MKANYDVVLRIKIEYEIDTLKDLKSAKEMSEDIAHMICDEVAVSGGVGSYDTIRSDMRVTPLYCKQYEPCPEHKKICCWECDKQDNCGVGYYADCHPSTCKQGTHNINHLT